MLNKEKLLKRKDSDYPVFHAFRTDKKFADKLNGICKRHNFNKSAFIRGAIEVFIKDYLNKEIK